MRFSPDFHAPESNHPSAGSAPPRQAADSGNPTRERGTMGIPLGVGRTEQTLCNCRNFK